METTKLIPEKLTESKNAIAAISDDDTGKAMLFLSFDADENIAFKDEVIKRYNQHDNLSGAVWILSAITFMSLLLTAYTLILE